jgi:hypothetical protein
MLHDPAVKKLQSAHVVPACGLDVVGHTHLSASVVVESDGDALTSINQGFSCASIKMSYPYLHRSWIERRGKRNNSPSAFYRSEIIRHSNGKKLVAQTPRLCDTHCAYECNCSNCQQYTTTV